MATAEVLLVCLPDAGVALPGDAVKAFHAAQDAVLPSLVMPRLPGRDKTLVGPVLEVGAAGAGMGIQGGPCRLERLPMEAFKAVPAWLRPLAKAHGWGTLAWHGDGWWVVVSPSQLAAVGAPGALGGAPC